MVLGSQAAVADGRLSAPARFSLRVNGRVVDVRVEVDNSNQTLADLVEDVNLGLRTAGVLDLVRAGKSDDRLWLATTDALDVSLEVTAADSVTNGQLGLAVGQVGVRQIVHGTAWKDLTIDGTTDVDWYRLEFGVAPTAGATLGVQSTGLSDALALRLYAGTPGNLTLLRAQWAADRAEGNDTAAAAYYLGSVAELAGLSLHTASDTDWYRFTVPAGTSSLPRKIAILPASTELALTGRLERLNGTEEPDRISVDPATGVLTVDLANDLPAGDYRLRLTGNQAGTYRLVSQLSDSVEGVVNLSGTSTADIDLAGLTANTPFWV